MHRRRRQAALLVAGLALLVFLPSIGTTFIYDDIQLVLKNEYVHSLRWLPRAFATHFWDVGTIATADEFNGAVETSRRYYRPLVTASFLLTWVLVGARAWVFHLTNVLVHAGTAGLATRAAIRWTRSLPLGLVVGLLFALHPTRSENVIWIAGRSDVLMLLFMLASLEAFTRFERGRAWGWLAGGVVLLAAGVLSKEPALMTPLLLLARERRRPDRITLAVPGSLCVLYGLARLVLWRAEAAAPHTPSPLGFLVTVGAYVHRIFVPWPPTMYYDEVTYDAAGHALFPWALVVVGALATAGMLAALALAWRRSRTAFWLLVTAVGFMAPILNLFSGVMKQPIQDRFLYASLLLGAAGLARLLRDRLDGIARSRAFVLAVVGLGLGAIGLIELRTPDYRSEDAFWEAELASHPKDPRALHMLGQNAASRGDLRLALRNFQLAADSGLHQRNDVLFIMSHFEEAAVLGALLPDGRIEELRAIGDELWRVVEPSTEVRRVEVEGFVVGGPLPRAALQQQHEFTAFYWDAALLATRTGDERRAEQAVRLASRGRTAAHPLNGALVLARIGQMSEARAVVAKVRETASFQDLASAAEYQALSARLDRAERFGVLRDEAAGPAERSSMEALRLAELGAYWSALKVLARGSLLDAPESATLTLQLLVACRLDGAAGELAERTWGHTRGAALVEKIRSELPPALEQFPPLDTPFDQVLTAAKRPP